MSGKAARCNVSLDSVSIEKVDGILIVFSGVNVLEAIELFKAEELSISTRVSLLFIVVYCAALYILFIRKL